MVSHRVSLNVTVVSKITSCKNRKIVYLTKPSIRQFSKFKIFVLSPKTPWPELGGLIHGFWNYAKILLSSTGYYRKFGNNNYSKYPSPTHRISLVRNLQVNLRFTAYKNCKPGRPTWSGCTRSDQRVRSAVVAHICSLQPVMSTAYQILEPSRYINWPDGRLRVKSQEWTLMLANFSSFQ